MIQTSKWFFQYGRWDLRIACPECGKKEAFFRSLSDVDEDNVIEDVKCRCGFRAKSIRLVGNVDEAVVNADNREKVMIKMFQCKLATFAEGNVLPQKKKRQG